MGILSMKFGRRGEEKVRYSEDDLKTQEQHKKSRAEALKQMGEPMTVKMLVTMPASLDGTSNKLLHKDAIYELPQRLAEGLIKSGYAVPKGGYHGI